MSFEEINDEIRAKGASWVNLKKKGDKVSGKIENVESRNQMFKGAVLTISKEGPNFGKPRKEWVFTLTTSDGNTVKTGLKESGQWAVTGALAGRKIAQGAHIQIEVMEEGVQGEKQAELKVIYTDPVVEFPVDGSDEPPF